MKATEMIEKLKELIEENGDYEVCYYDAGAGLVSAENVECTEDITKKSKIFYID
ncbi:hypothetical protein D3C85_1717570 [compost metagenome]